jgi:hypothetical protein
MIFNCNEFFQTAMGELWCSDENWGARGNFVNSNNEMEVVLVGW